MNDIEQQFFKTFGIEPKDYYSCNWDGYCPYPLEENNKCGKRCPNWEKYKTSYPEITEEKLLQIIYIIADGKDGDKNLNLYTANEDEWFAVLKDKYGLAYCAAIDKDFKNAILKLCIYRVDIEDFKNQVRSLFKEAE